MFNFETENSQLLLQAKQNEASVHLQYRPLNDVRWCTMHHAPNHVAWNSISGDWSQRFCRNFRKTSGTGGCGAPCASSPARLWLTRSPSTRSFTLNSCVRTAQHRQHVTPKNYTAELHTFASANKAPATLRGVAPSLRTAKNARFCRN